MTSRRTQATLAGVAVLALLAFGVAGCSNSTTPNDNTQRTFNSTSNNAHIHTVTILRTEVETPPSGGISKTTSSNSAHTHSFAMSEAQLTTVNGGGTATITSGNSDVGGAHTHDFTITKWF